MIAEIIQVSNGTIIKPLYDSIEPFIVWEIMYKCGFDNMVVTCADGYENALMIYNDAPEYF